MNNRLSIAELVGRGVELRSFEAVAIARALIYADQTAVDPAFPVGPPTLSTVRIDENGTVSCDNCGIAPSVAEVAMLLDDMLRPGHTKVGGGLRFAIARALQQADAPRFVSLGDFSRVLQRYQQGEPADVIRQLWLRSSSRAAPQ